MNSQDRAGALIVLLAIEEQNNGKPFPFSTHSAPGRPDQQHTNIDMLEQDGYITFEEVRRAEDGHHYSGIRLTAEGRRLANEQRKIRT